ncbi:hypothetical protein AMATHDRAFT_10247 [Amanita thiersii Skay4041]|uniref:Uncharacterized protein n=1 Tax=Amanita thiersii Skay4041 TaxID=703135 RepID=A0A2A9NB38_9AGAR|nr:hypothetical protein AMATHDRAFT_10247 [Amanita thiersii Skay4041]
MLFASPFCFLLALSTLSISAPSKRDFPQLEADTNTIIDQTIALDNDVKVFIPSPTLVGSLDIHNDMLNLIDALNIATTDVQTSVPISESEAQTLWEQCQELELITADTLNQFIAAKPSYQVIPISGIISLVHQDLTQWKAAVAGFLNSYIWITPAVLLNEAINISDDVLALFDEVIALYAS